MGKKKEEWVTRKKIRLEKEENPILNLWMILTHFFGELMEWISGMEDPRNQSYITYTQNDLIVLGMLKNFCSIESMRSMTEKFNEEQCIKNLYAFTGHEGLKETPHYDTLNNYLERLSPDALADVRKRMIAKLIRSKVFDYGKLNGKYWRIIFDGTGLFYFKEKHCENCLRETYTGSDGQTSVRYFHKVLEVKLKLSDKIVISLGTEFIENENEDVKKQDCEINAAKRLMKRIKQDFPRMNFCMQGDALYAVESIMELCSEYYWKYLFTQKETRQVLVGAAYNELEDCDKTKVSGVGKEKGTAYFYNHAEKLAGKKQVMNILEYVYEPDKNSGDGKKRMLWLTNINLTQAKVGEMVDSGRGRWDIENKGFNRQKNVLYKIQHINSRNSNAMKNHYLLTQIADIIMQLYLAWGDLHRTAKQGLKITAEWLLESFRKMPITEEALANIGRRTSIYLR